MKLEIQIEERLSLTGYVYWRDRRGEGRLFWSAEKPEGRKKHRLVLQASSGAPLDGTFEEIKRRLIAHCTNPNRPPALLTPCLDDE